MKPTDFTVLSYTPLRLTMKVVAILCICFAASQAAVVPWAYPYLPYVAAPLVKSEDAAAEVKTVPLAHAVYPHYYYGHPMPLEAPKIEFKSVELPKTELKALPLAPFHPLHLWNHAAVIKSDEGKAAQVKTLPYAYPWYPYTPVALEAPKIELKTIETPAEFKTLPFPFTGYPYPLLPLTVAKAEEKAEEVKAE